MKNKKIKTYTFDVKSLYELSGKINRTIYPIAKVNITANRYGLNTELNIEIKLNQESDASVKLLTLQNIIETITVPERLKKFKKFLVTHIFIDAIFYDSQTKSRTRLKFDFPDFQKFLEIRNKIYNVFKEVVVKSNLDSIYIKISCWSSGDNSYLEYLKL